MNPMNAGTACAYGARRIVILGAAVAACLGMTGTTGAGTCTFTNTGNWSVTGNWDAYPGNGDDVVIAAATCTLDTPIPGLNSITVNVLKKLVLNFGNGNSTQRSSGDKILLTDDLTLATNATI